VASLMPKCTQCGKVDTRNSWSSADEAAKAGAFDGKWSCASCAWTEFDLVEADENAQVGEPAGRR